MKLDVGCGNNPAGDVNCDLYIRDTLNHRNLGSSNSIDVSTIPNFIICSGLQLPFKSKSFSESISRQTIEHTEQPQQFLSEMFRVTQKKVTVETVHRIGEGLSMHPKHRKWFRQHHVSKFNGQWFSRVAKLYGFAVEVTETLSYHFIPNHLFRLFAFPYEMRVRMVAQ